MSEAEPYVCRVRFVVRRKMHNGQENFWLSQAPVVQCLPLSPGFAPLRSGVPRPWNGGPAPLRGRNRRNVAHVGSSPRLRDRRLTLPLHAFFASLANAGLSL